MIEQYKFSNAKATSFFIPMLVRFFILLLFLNVLAAQDDAMYVGIDSISNDIEGKSVVSLKMQNSVNAPVTGARVWVFVIDQDDKVVGNEASWIISADTSTSLLPNQTKIYPVKVETSSQGHRAKIVFSKLLIGGEAISNPQSIIKEFPKKEAEQ